MMRSSLPRLVRFTNRSLLPPAVALALLLVIWEIYAQLLAGRLPGGERVLPPPSHVVSAFFTNPNAALLLPHTWQTLVETVVGFALALVVGLGLAVVIDLSPTMRSAIYPLLVGSQTIPILAIAPLLVLLFEFGLLPKVLIVALVCFFPIVVSGVDGLRSTDPELGRLFRTFGADKWTIMRMVRFPGALPSIFSGVKIAITYSVTGAVWGEYVGAQWGLGIFMQQQQHSFQVTMVFAAIIVIAALSIALFLLTSLVERLMIPWYFAGRQNSEAVTNSRDAKKTQRTQKNYGYGGEKDK